MGRAENGRRIKDGGDRFGLIHRRGLAQAHNHGRQLLATKGNGDQLAQLNFPGHMSRYVVMEGQRQRVVGGRSFIIAGLGHFRVGNIGVFERINKRAPVAFYNGAIYYNFYIHKEC